MIEVTTIQGKLTIGKGILVVARVGIKHGRRMRRPYDFV